MNNIEQLVGLTLKSVTHEYNEDRDFIVFKTTDNRTFEMSNSTELGRLDYIIGNLVDLIASPIIRTDIIIETPYDGDFYETYTSFEFVTNKGYITFKWFCGCEEPNINFFERTTNG